MAQPIKVAVTQASPAYVDLAGFTKKACGLIAEAAQNGAKLLRLDMVRPVNLVIPSAGKDVSDNAHKARPVNFELQTGYIYNSLLVESEAMEVAKTAAKEHSICVVLGFSEQSPPYSFYISQAIISPQGEVLMHRRKIKTTHMERTVFGDGFGPDLNNVVEVDFGEQHGKIKIGALACWEHTQPLIKFHSISQDETIHVSMWPPLDHTTGPDHPGLWSMTAERSQNMSQTYAIESTAYVLHCTSVCTQEGIETLKTQEDPACREPGGGQSCVIAPDGRRLTEPLDGGNPESEGIVYAELDLTKNVATPGFLDILGHYSRPDLLWLGVDKRRKDNVVVEPQTATESQKVEE